MHANIIGNLVRLIYGNVKKETRRPESFSIHVSQLNHSVSSLKASYWQAILGNRFIPGGWYIIQHSEHYERQLWTCDCELHSLIPVRIESIVLNNSRLLGGITIGRNSMNFHLTIVTDITNKYHHAHN